MNAMATDTARPAGDSKARASMSVVIVNWNSAHYLKQCLASLALHAGDAVREIVVVDNGSQDGSVDGIEGQQRLRLVRAQDNLGFAKACNLGAQGCSGEFLLFLNPDAALFEGTLAAMLTFMQQPAHASVGIAGCQLVDEDQAVARSCARFPSAGRAVLQSLGLDRLRPHWGHFMQDWDHALTRPVDQVIGAFFLVRAALFEQLGGFDERFFLYFEETDFSLRAKRKGWQSVYVAETQAFHAGGGSSRQIRARRLFYVLRSRLLYAAKHFGATGAVLAIVATLFVEPVTRTCAAALSRDWQGCKQTWQAYGMLGRWLAGARSRPAGP